MGWLSLQRLPSQVRRTQKLCFWQALVLDSVGDGPVMFRVWASVLPRFGEEPEDSAAVQWVSDVRGEIAGRLVIPVAELLEVAGAALGGYWLKNSGRRSRLSPGLLLPRLRKLLAATDEDRLSDQLEAIGLRDMGELLGQAGNTYMDLGWRPNPGVSGAAWHVGGLWEGLEHLWPTVADSAFAALRTLAGEGYVVTAVAGLSGVWFTDPFDERGTRWDYDDRLAVPSPFWRMILPSAMVTESVTDVPVMVERDGDHAIVQLADAPTDVEGIRRGWDTIYRA